MYCELCGCNCDGDEIEMKSGLCCHCYHSTRNQFAAAALTGLVDSGVDYFRRDLAAKLAKESFYIASEMMQARKKQ
jgi:hypothetical protein